MTGQRPPAGFTLVELLIAMAILTAIAGAVFSLVNPAGEQVLVQPEAQDLQQRLRVAAGVLQRDLRMAGAGVYVTQTGEPLVHALAPVRPYRTGETNPDPERGVFYRADTVSLTYVPATVAQAEVEQVTPAPGGIAVRVRANCGGLVRDRVCGFLVGTPVLMYDGGGRVDHGTVAAVDGLHIALEGGAARVGPGGLIAEVVTVVYTLGTDAATGAPRLMRYDGRRSTQPVADHMVGLRFEYFGDPQPPRRLAGAPLDGPAPWTTYGPKPPPVDEDPADMWPPGENCVFAVVDGAHVPRLPVLGPAGRLVMLEPPALTDGPWCPDALDPERFDADLLRIRRVRALVRGEAALDALRGPAGPLFRRPGRSPSPRTWVPDQEVVVDVVPRNLALRP